MPGKEKNNNKWGGKRSGSGRKPKYMLTENQIKTMMKKARKREKETGKSIDDLLLDVIYYTGKNEVRDKLAAIKLFKDYTMQKTSEKDVNVNINHGPKVGLPPMREDPAKQVEKDDQPQIH